MLGHSLLNPPLHFPLFGVAIGLFTLPVSLIKCFIEEIIIQWLLPRCKEI